MKDSKQVSVKEVFRHQLSFMMEVFSDTDTNHGPLVYNLKSVRIYRFSFIILIKKSFAYGEWQAFAKSLGRTLISFIHNMTLSAPREYLLTIFLVVESRQFNLCQCVRSPKQRLMNIKLSQLLCQRSQYSTMK